MFSAVMIKNKAMHHDKAGGKKMAKRKAEVNAIEKYSKTPKKNLQESEYSAEFSQDEDPMKMANRNSKHGREGRA
ncbi:hypothetical protein PB1_02250 [Bacillus methanolicus PB1]|uniref:Stage 0 sporulation regulatory protein n=2 Tax=Bacillus methanolicus TaxID=1471 RepID=I3E5F2_BACMT|nr:hypothetical protein PB1_02250 [Bacillus methanolicus PB1]